VAFCHRRLLQLSFIGISDMYSQMKRECGRDLQKTSMTSPSSSLSPSHPVIDVFRKSLSYVSLTLLFCKSLSQGSLISLFIMRINIRAIALEFLVGLHSPQDVVSVDLCIESVLKVSFSLSGLFYKSVL